jgi:hypothetical protein
MPALEHQCGHSLRGGAGVRDLVAITKRRGVGPDWFRGNATSPERQSAAVSTTRSAPDAFR